MPPPNRTPAIRAQEEGAGPEPRPSSADGMAAVLFGLARRLRLPALERRHDSRHVVGLFALINGALSIAILSLLAWVSSEPFIFPSLGPTAFLLFYQPLAAASSPRNTVAGHAIGIGAAWLALLIFGLWDAPPALSGALDGSYVGAAAVSLGLTSGLMIWLDVPHPPACATTLIVGLGIITGVANGGIIMLGVIGLVLQAVVINRLAGLPYPLWSPRSSRAADSTD